MSNKFEIFISYRRKGGYDTAKLLYDKLRIDGYSVSFDIETLEKGNFDKELEKRVTDCKDFLLVLNSGIFDRFSNPDYDPEDDWVRREIACALSQNKNIVPLFLEGFDYPKILPDDIKGVTRKNSIDLSPQHFEGAYARMKQVFLTSKPNWAIEHKKKIIAGVSIALIVLLAFLFFTIFAISSQKNLELQKAKMEADSIIEAKEAEMEHFADSIKRSIVRQEKRASERKMQEPATADSSQKTPGKALYWGGSNSDVGQVIFEKIEAAGVKKEKCSGPGMVIKNNEASCKEADSEFTCAYSPKLTITNCDGKIHSLTETSVTFQTQPQANEAFAREELIKELRSTDFSSWISSLLKVMYE
jgi:hypothetical protein